MPGLLTLNLHIRAHLWLLIRNPQNTGMAEGKRSNHLPLPLLYTIMESLVKKTQRFNYANKLLAKYHDEKSY